jgi:hypothetical protein
MVAFLNAFFMHLHSGEIAKRAKFLLQNGSCMFMTFTQLTCSHILRAGKGALAQHGNYWYPVRLLQPLASNSWQVSWWRGNHYGDTSPSMSGPVREEDLVDELWGDVEARRKIRVSSDTLHSPLSRLILN